MGTETKPVTRKRGPTYGTIRPKPGQRKPSPQGCLLRFLAMGDTRTLPQLHALLEGDGYQVRLKELQAWSARDGWMASAREFDAARAVALQDELFVAAKTMDLRQARTAMSMQAIVDKSVASIDDEGLVLEAKDVPRWMEVAARLERLARGQATSRTDGTNVYNTVIMPVLTLFQQVVNNLPERYRDDVTRQFADGVNQIRDAVVVPAEADGKEGEQA